MSFFLAYLLYNYIRPTLFCGNALSQYSTSVLKPNKFMTYVINLKFDTLLTCNGSLTVSLTG